MLFNGRETLIMQRSLVCSHSLQSAFYTACKINNVLPEPNIYFFSPWFLLRHLVLTNHPSVSHLTLRGSKLGVAYKHAFSWTVVPVRSSLDSDVSYLHLVFLFGIRAWIQLCLLFLKQSSMAVRGILLWNEGKLLSGRASFFLLFQLNSLGTLKQQDFSVHSFFFIRICFIRRSKLKFAKFKEWLRTTWGWDFEKKRIVCFLA